MGLDQYLRGQIYINRNDYKTNEPNNDFKIVSALFGIEPFIEPDGFAGMHLSFPVGYWRKANQIHKWFVENVQYNEDNCREYMVDREQLSALKKLCQTVLDNPERAEELLPVQQGFFFGSYEYDEYYFSDLRETVEILNRVEQIPQHVDMVYDSSW